jgi:hypothetical protein
MDALPLLALQKHIRIGDKGRFVQIGNAVGAGAPDFGKDNCLFGSWKGASRHVASGVRLQVYPFRAI